MLYFKTQLTKKDLQSPIKIWDPKSGQSITTLYAHKGTVMDIQWAKNGYWLASAARDHLVKVILINLIIK